MKISKAYGRGVAVAVVMLCCCVPPLLLPSEQDADRAHNEWSDMNLDKLNSAHQLYANKCGSCHYLHRPTKHTEEGWKKIMPEMAVKAKLDSSQYNLVLRYLITMSEATPPSKNSPH